MKCKCVMIRPNRARRCHAPVGCVLSCHCTGGVPAYIICLAFCLLHACGPFCLACVALVLCALHAPPVAVV